MRRRAQLIVVIVLGLTGPPGAGLARQGDIAAAAKTTAAAGAPSAPDKAAQKQPATPPAGQAAIRCHAGQVVQLPCWMNALLDGPAGFDALCAAAAAILTYLAFHPILAFWRRGWTVKKDDILSSLTTASKRLYLITFQRWQSVKGDLQNVSPGKHDIELGGSRFVAGKAASAEAVFESMYEFRYGRHRLIIPAILLVLVTAPQLYLLSQAALARLLVPEHSGWTPLAFSHTYAYGGASLPGAAAAAVAGAYIWVVLAFIKGASRANLPPGDVLAGALRLAVAVPIGYAFAALATPALGAFLAFAAGAFPLATVQLLLRRLATDTLKLNVGPTDAEGEVASIDGVDLPTADRLRDADVSTVAQLAYCDPVQVSMKTNIDFAAILDAQNQALAYVYFGQQLAALRPMGLRGAIECLNLKDALAGDRGRDAEGVGLAVLDTAAQVLYPDKVQGGDVLRNALSEIAGDPYTLFLDAVWSDA